MEAQDKYSVLFADGTVEEGIIERPWGVSKIIDDDTRVLLIEKLQEQFDEMLEFVDNQEMEPLVTSEIQQFIGSVLEDNLGLNNSDQIADVILRLEVELLNFNFKNSMRARYLEKEEMRLARIGKITLKEIFNDLTSLTIKLESKYKDNWENFLEPNAALVKDINTELESIMLKYNAKYFREIETISGVRGISRTIDDFKLHMRKFAMKLDDKKEEKIRLQNEINEAKIRLQEEELLKTRINRDLHEIEGLTKTCLELIQSRDFKKSTNDLSIRRLSAFINGYLSTFIPGIIDGIYDETTNAEIKLAFENMIDEINNSLKKAGIKKQVVVCEDRLFNSNLNSRYMTNPPFSESSADSKTNPRSSFSLLDILRTAIRGDKKNDTSASLSIN